MINIKTKENCCGCSACSQICPQACIEMHEDHEGFLYPAVDIDLCIHCQICEKVCPVINVHSDEGEKVIAFAAYNKDERQRLDSSSGGIFTVLAEKIINQNGIIFGAAISKDCRMVNHIAVENADELWQLRGSKYLQSQIGNNFVRVKFLLDRGEKVLFSGTPCEIEGLKSFLRKDYENLLCVDFICHGTPSPKLWGKYIGYHEKRAGASVRRVFFRHKKYGWEKFVVLFEFKNNTTYEQIFSKDLFFQMFLQDLCLRPSCYQCVFKKKNRVSDITLADFWGCNDICADLNDNKGLSLVLVHNKYGNNLFNQIKDRLVIREVSVEEAINSNQSMIKSCPKPLYRNVFMSEIDKISISELGNKYLKRRTIVDIVKERVPKKVKLQVKKFLRQCKTK
ncbi:4Fe-4S dicluster domain-containing protein [Aminipila butyrica]|uniref:4Fe-4S dicluster domain-containing protein n=1 Tax=Aminipila butyrica TaxID=433296 RepID=A0A858BVM0_9FIRM|nr:Coenzyme F420 hydrogenase/dehydrogenase, beta subunit C-terminal domain [Aminipila butyrica]QIB69115.1 4Fe-4S dicluster domain-containing protein [Aminipila butyrica]